MADKPVIPDATESGEPGKPQATPVDSQSVEREAVVETAQVASDQDVPTLAESAADSETQDPVSKTAVDAPEFDISPLESLIFSMRTSSPMHVTIDLPEAKEDLIELEHPLGHPEAPIHLSSLGAEEEPFIDPGLPIPEAYDADMISALVQDPFRIYIYWEIRPETLRSINKLFTPEEVKTFQPVLRVTDKSNEEETYYPVKIPSSDWLSVSPGRTYVVEFGVYSPSFGFVRLMAAPEVTTPRGTVAPPSTEPDFQISTARFKKLLRASGFSAHAGALPHETLAEWLPAHVTDAFIQAGAGEPLQEIHLEAIPETVRDILSELIAHGEGEMAANSLLHYLPSVLRDAYVAYLAGRGMPTGIRNVEHLRDLVGPLDLEGERVADSEEWTEYEYSEWEEIEDEDFFAPGLLRFGIGSSAGSELGSLHGRRRRRLPRRVPRRRPVLKQVERPAPWLPSMDRPASSGGRALLLPMDLDVPPLPDEI